MNFHTLAIPVPADEAEAQKIFGEKVDVAFGIGTDAVYVAVGDNNIDTVNKAIDASKSEAGKEVPPFEFSASLGQIMEFAAANAKDEDKPMVQGIADMLKSDAQGRDHVRASAHADRERPQVSLRSRRRRPPRGRQGCDDGPAKGPDGSHAGPVIPSRKLNPFAAESRECQTDER